MLFVNAPVNTFASIIICAMHKKTKIIFFHNLPRERLIFPGTVGPSRPGLETECNQNILFLTTVSKPGRIRPTVHWYITPGKREITFERK